MALFFLKWSKILIFLRLRRKFFIFTPPEEKNFTPPQNLGFINPPQKAKSLPLQRPLTHAHVCLQVIGYQSRSFGHVSFQ